MELHIVRSDDTLTSRDLKDRLETLPNWDSTITLEIRDKQGMRVRTVDPTILAAIIGVAGTALGTLISGLLQVAQANYKEKVVLVTKDGLRIEVEARHAQDKIPELIKLLRLMEIGSLEV